MRANVRWPVVAWTGLAFAEAGFTAWNTATGGTLTPWPQLSGSALALLGCLGLWTGALGNAPVTGPRRLLALTGMLVVLAVVALAIQAHGLSR